MSVRCRNDIEGMIELGDEFDQTLRARAGRLVAQKGCVGPDVLSI
jgi:hypothetical protein